MIIFKHKKNKQFYIISRSHGLRSFNGVTLIVEPYNRGLNEEDKKLIFKANGPRRKKVDLSDFEVVGVLFDPADSSLL
jgi:hypothetical protein